MSRLEKLSNRLEKFSSRLKKFSSRLEKFSSQLEKFFSQLEKFFSRLEKLLSRLEKLSSWLEKFQAGSRFLQLTGETLKPDGEILSRVEKFRRVHNFVRDGTPYGLDSLPSLLLFEGVGGICGVYYSPPLPVPGWYPLQHLAIGLVTLLSYQESYFHPP